MDVADGGEFHVYWEVKKEQAGCLRGDHGTIICGKQCVCAHGRVCVSMHVCVSVYMRVSAHVCFSKRRKQAGMSRMITVGNS